MCVSLPEQQCSGSTANSGRNQAMKDHPMCQQLADKLTCMVQTCMAAALAACNPGCCSWVLCRRPLAAAACQTDTVPTLPPRTKHTGTRSLAQGQRQPTATQKITESLQCKKACTAVCCSTQETITHRGTSLPAASAALVCCAVPNCTLTPSHTKSNKTTAFKGCHFPTQ
jgi:hypothetical protein